MKISKIRYFGVNNNSSRFLARCSVVIEDTLVLHDIELLNGKKGRYIVMPSRKSKGFNQNMNKEKEDLFHPVNKEFFDYLTETIITGYENCLDNKDYIFIP